MPLLPWQRNPWQRKANGPAATPATLSFKGLSRRPTQALASLTSEVSRWLTGLCRPAPNYCPDDPLLEAFAAPRNEIRDQGDRYDLSVKLPSLDAKHVSVFSQGQRLLLCGKQRQVQGQAPSDTSKSTTTCADASGCQGCEAGQLLRSFRFPANADLPHMSAAFLDGSLAVRVPKSNAVGKHDADAETDARADNANKPTVNPPPESSKEA